MAKYFDIHVLKWLYHKEDNHLLIFCVFPLLFQETVAQISQKNIK